MHQYRIHVLKLMDETLRHSDRHKWEWVGEYHSDPESALAQASKYREVYANVRIVHRGEVWMTLD